ncbi:MAG: nucleoside kinase [Paludibacteraceae bacterium]|nr:nucleoside kinase [Paludibacteraceae bacterium]
MQNTVTIFCKNTEKYYDVPRGSSILEIYNLLGISLPYQVVAARVNYKVENLNYYVYRPKDIEFIDASCPSGMRVYVRTLSMVLACAIRELEPNCDLRIEHPISKGYYCRVLHRKPEKGYEPVSVNPQHIEAIKQRMNLIIKEDRKIVSEEKQTKVVMQLFKESYDSEANLFETLGEPYSAYVHMEYKPLQPSDKTDYLDNYNGVLLPSTGYLNIFDLEPYFDGMLLRVPNRMDPSRLEDMVSQEKMFGIFSEYVGWNHLMKIDNVADFNVACKKNKAFDMIKLSEALHEKKISQIADMIAHRPGGRPKFVLISGPSSSGKTTFSKRLVIQLRVNGIQPVVISMDNYFVNREDTPKDENGEYDFEDINALDLKLFRQHVNDLLDGKEISLPTFNFEDGKRYFLGNKLRIEEDNIIILEGIHALNPDLIPDVPRFATFRIYVSALTTINLDNHNWIPTTDTRLLRRIVRDYRYRNYSAQETIARVASVRRGEEKWIYPYQENADVMFNSALLFELAVLKRHAEQILAEVPKYCDEYTEAYRLKKFLQYFISIPEKEIPPTSLLREFVGGSSFRY